MVCELCLYKAVKKENTPPTRAETTFWFNN